MRRAAALCCAAVAVGASLWPGADPQPHPEFRAVRPAVATDEAPFYAEEFLNEESSGRMCHVASLCELSDGRLASVWYSGTAECAPDVTIEFASRAPGDGAAWSAPRTIVTRESASRESKRFVKAVGNPVVFADDRDRLWLLHSAILLGGHAGSSLDVATSDDGGATWGRRRRLTLSPFLNVSELARGRPVPLEGGGFAIPVYHELLGKFPEMLWLSAAESRSGLAWRKTRLAGGRSFLQPVVVPADARNAVAFLRDRSRRRAVTMQATRDGGATWSAPVATDLPSPDAPVDVLPMSDGRLLIAFNDSPSGRSVLRLAASSDRGATWKRIATLEDEPGGRFAYPYMIRARDGRLHLVYSWQMRRIRHVTFNEAWLRAREAAR